MIEITTAELTKYVSSGRQTVSDTDYIATCASDAVDMVRAHMVRFRISDDIPTSTVKRAMLIVGAELVNQRNAPNGISQFLDGSGSAMRVSRDPLVGVRPLLDPYRLDWGFA